MNPYEEYNPFGDVKLLERKLQLRQGLWYGIVKILDRETGAIFYKKARDKSLSVMLSWLLPDYSKDQIRFPGYPKDIS